MLNFLFENQEDQEELSPSPTEEPWPKKFPEPLSWRSDEEDEDSDFGEEQRDRYLKVWSQQETNKHLNIIKISGNFNPRKLQALTFFTLLHCVLTGERFDRASGVLCVSSATAQSSAGGLQRGSYLCSQSESANGRV